MGSFWSPSDVFLAGSSKYVADRLTHWGRVTHICVSKLAIIVSDNGLSPGRRQAIIRTNARILLIRPLGTNFNEMLIEIVTFSFMKNAFESDICEKAFILSRPQCVKNWYKTAKRLCYWVNYCRETNWSHMRPCVWDRINIVQYLFLAIVAKYFHIFFP